jgi:ABC-type branched-subunit amino acid transport system ATPase component
MILELQHIKKTFGSLNVLDDISLGILPGTVTAIFGENGSGKTTLFHLISGFLKPDAGIILFHQKSLEGQSPFEIAKRGIGRVWQTPRVFLNLPVLDNLILAAHEHPGNHILNYLIRPNAILQAEKQLKERASAIAGTVNLAGKLQKTAGSLSLGQQKLLSTGMLLMGDASLLLMDEPFAGLSPQMVDHISEVVSGLRGEGKSICLIEHNRHKAVKISDTTISIVKGKIGEITLING